MKSINPKFTASPSSISHSTERENKKSNKKRKKSKTPRQRGGDRGRRPQQQQQPQKRPPQGGSVGSLRPIRPRLPPIGTETPFFKLFDFFSNIVMLRPTICVFPPLQSAALALLLLLADLPPGPRSSAAAARGEEEGEDLGRPLETLHSGASREDGSTISCVPK